MANIIELGGVINNFFSRKYYIIKDENLPAKVASFIKKRNYEDVYYCIYEYENDNIEICPIIAPLYFDIDYDIHTKADYEKVRKDTIKIILYFQSYLKIDPNDIEIYFSGNKGFHILIDSKIIGMIPCTDLNIIYKEWVKYVSYIMDIDTVDLKIYDRKRLFRIPNTINKKTGLYKIQITIQELYTLSYDEIIDLAKKPRPLLKKKKIFNLKAGQYFYSKTKELLTKRKELQNNRITRMHNKIFKKEGKILPCIALLLKMDCPKGERNSKTILLASAIFQTGKSMEETLEIVKRWNEENTDPLPLKEIETTVRSAHTMYSNNKGYGCTHIKELGLCDKNCSILKKKGAKNDK